MSSLPSSAVGIVHNSMVLNRRVQVLSDWFAQVLPRDARVLDVGCGDGSLSALLMSKRADLEIQGIDVLVRNSSRIQVSAFDGEHIPFPDNSFAVALFSDVLHHTVDPMILLREAKRVAPGILIKDHFRKGFAAYSRLRFMDWVGNARFGVALPNNYWTESRWRVAWQELNLEPQTLLTQLALYPSYANWVFGAQLHFIALLARV